MRADAISRLPGLTIARLLGHHVAGVTARYAYVLDAALVAAADGIAALITKALG